MEKSIYGSITGRKSDYHSAILTTFSINFHHFEHRVLRELKRNSIYNIGVLSDSRLLDASLGLSSAGLQQMSKSYSINGIQSRGAFHPKLNFIIGDDKLMLTLGSGNLTLGGFGKNHETFSTLAADTMDSPLVPLLNEAWSYLTSFTDKLAGYSKHRITSLIPNNCNLISQSILEKHQYYTIDSDTDIALIYNEAESSILSQLIARIPVNKINTITIVSPYFDEDGSLLISLLDQFPNTIIEAYLPSQQGLLPTRLAPNPRIKIYEWDSTKRAKQASDDKQYRKLHSKLFFFSGDESEYMMLGSANATLPAFGSLERRGINDEFGILYKSKTADYLKHFGITGKKTTMEPSKLHRATSEQLFESKTSHQLSVRLIGCDLEHSKLKLFSVFEQTPENIKLIIYNDLGIELETINISELKSEQLVSIDLSKFESNPSYIQLFDESSQEISNKQIINYNQRLSNTNPNKELRTIRAIRNAIELGQFDEMKLLEYLLILNKEDQRPKSCGNSDKPDDDVGNAEMTFKEAMAAHESKQLSANLASSHHTVQIWDSMSSLIRTRHESVKQQKADEEETGDASSGDTAFNDNEAKDSHNIIIRSVNQFKMMEKLAMNSTTNMNKAMIDLSRSSECYINEVLLTQFLMISHLLTSILRYNSYSLKKETTQSLEELSKWKIKSAQLYQQLMSEVLVCFSRLLLNAKPLVLNKETYREQKISDLTRDVIYYILAYKLLLSKCGKDGPIDDIIDLSYLNIYSKLGYPKTDYLDILDILNTSNTTELFDMNGITKQLENICSMRDRLESKQGLFTHNHKTYGICLVKSQDEKKVRFKSVYRHQDLHTISYRDWMKL